MQKPKSLPKTTIGDVAKLAGVSVATVSRVFNDSGYPVSKESRERVLRAAETLSYSPNSVARSLKKASNNEIGVIVPTITNPFYSQAILGIEQELQRSGYNLLLCNSFREPQRERDYLNSLYSKQIMGVIISSVTHEGGNVKEFAQKGISFMLLDQKIPGINCDYISFDSREGARLAVAYLISRGHRRIALVTTPLTRWTRQEIFAGYRQALFENEIEYDPSLLFEAGEEHEDPNTFYENRTGGQLARDFLAQGRQATACLCVNDMVAFSFIQELNANKVSVPGDVSVVGFDDIPFASMFSPALTTVHCPSVEMGRMAAKMLIETFSGRESTQLGVKLAPSIMERNSVRSI